MLATPATQIAHRAARAISKRAQAGSDSLNGGEIVGVVPFLFNQSVAHLFDAHAGRPGVAAAFGVIAAPGFHDVADVVQEIGQTRLDRFASPEMGGVYACQTAFEFAHALADGCAVPAKFALSETLPARTQRPNGARHEDPAFAAFQRLGGFD